MGYQRINIHHIIGYYPFCAIDHYAGSRMSFTFDFEGVLRSTTQLAVYQLEPDLPYCFPHPYSTRFTGILGGKCFARYMNVGVKYHYSPISGEIYPPGKSGYGCITIPSIRY